MIGRHSVHTALRATAVGLVEGLTWQEIFDGLNLGSGFSLRGAGDAAVPAMLALLLSWFGFVPLAHMLAFSAGEGFVDWLPAVGLGAVGGWIALLAYVAALGIALYLRWRSGAWQRIRL